MDEDGNSDLDLEKLQLEVCGDAGWDNDFCMMLPDSGRWRRLRTVGFGDMHLDENAAVVPELTSSWLPPPLSIFEDS
jgi:hypothetical protein